jgi:ubiquinone/menaquinone biosynthesis C-methylase UbiE
MTDNKVIDTSYEPFSRQPEYVEVNRGFIQSLQLEDCHSVLDIACGTGTLTELVIQSHSIEQIIGLDLSHEQLVLATDHFMNNKFSGTDERLTSRATIKNRPHMIFLRGTADRLPIKAHSMDAAVMGNAFHNLPDQDLLLEEIHRILKPGCVFAFNTSFFAGTYPPGTEKLYYEWLKIALSYIQKKDKELRGKGKKGISRKRGTSHKAFSKKWPTADEFTDLLMKNAFEIKWFCHRQIIMDHHSLEKVGAYAGLATVLLSGYPVEIACEALEAAAKPAFESFGCSEVRRLWLEFVAVKKD